MRDLVDLRHGVEMVAQDAGHYGAVRTARRLREAFRLLNQQRFDPLYLDIIPRLLDSSLLRQEIEVAARHKVEHWYTARNILVLLLLIITLLVLSLAAITYLGWWPNGGITPFILPLSIPVDFALFSFWSFCIGRIQWSKHRAEQAYARLSVDLQDITKGFLLNAAENSPVLPRDSSDALRFAVDQIKQALQDLVKTNQDTIKDAVNATQGINADLGKRVEALFQQQIIPLLTRFDQDTATFHADLKVAQFATSDYAQGLTKASHEITKVLQEIKDINIDHFRVEEDLSNQINILSNAQQTTASKTEVIAASMSTAAQSVVNIADQLARQQQGGLVATEERNNVGTKSVMQYDFDVYLCYDSKDKSSVMAIGEQLKALGIVPWLDEWELRPGTPWQSVLENQISHIKSAAVFLGEGEVGPWQQMEQRAFLREFVKRGLPVIPVLLTEYDKANPELPAFLRSLTWVDFRQQDPDPLEALIWGITGKAIAS